VSRFESTFLDSQVGSDPTPRSLNTALRANLSSFRPDVVIVYGYTQSLQRAALKWCHFSKTPIAYISDSELRHHQSKTRTLLKRALLGRLFSRVSFFLTVGDANEDYYRYSGVPKAKFLRMHFPIDRDLYDASFRARENLRVERRADIGLANEDLLVTMVGKLIPQKAQMDLIRAAQLAHGEDRRIRLMIIGSGPLADAYAEASQDDSVTRFSGFVTPAELPSYYAASDVYVHSSSVDPHPLAVSEAAAMGCPLVISNTVGSWGPEDDLIPFVNGFVYQQGSIAELAQILVLLAKNEGVRRSQASASRIHSYEFQERAHRGIILDLATRISL
jgi:glycosyltransferase involved in cell wall biosynthesis